MKKKVIMIVCVLTVLGIAAYIVWDNYEIFKGQRVKNPDCYSIEFELMNQKDTHTIALQAGDILTVDFSVARGRLDMTVIHADGKAIYTGNDLHSGVFDLIADREDVYTITVSARHATGFVNISAAEKKGE